MGNQKETIMNTTIMLAALAPVLSLFVFATLVLLLVGLVLMVVRRA